MDESEVKRISRGDFLKVAGSFCIASVVAACGLETIATQPPPPPTTGGEQQVQTEYNLTELNALTFWLFIANRNNHLGRRAIARQLNMSINTLKDHISRIIRHVQKQGNPGVATLNDAVNVAVNTLGLN
jgi:hypothetical protein